MVHLSIHKKPLLSTGGDVIVFLLNDALDLSSYGLGDTASEIGALMQKVKFQGQWGRAELFIAPRSLYVPFIAVVGVGGKDMSEAERAEGVRRGIATVIVDGRNHLLRDVVVALPDATYAMSVAESALLTDYWFSDHSAQMKLDQGARSLKTLSLHIPNQKDAPQAMRDVRRVQNMMTGVDTARRLVNQPASHMSPSVLVQEAKKIAKRSPLISLQVFNRKQSEKKNFSAFLAVAKGSKEEPYAIHLRYTPKKKTKKSIALIGKGITFDSGGLSLKPAQSMETMKVDMAGAATVLGLFSILPYISPNVAVHGIIFACENMPSGDAYRPGDVVTAMNGKTIEVLNTDAEGRVTLADAISYASTFGPDAIVDLATLTGACVVALGETYAGLFGNDKNLNEVIMQSAKQAGEGVVEFPLPNEYIPTVQSQVADLRNTSIMKTGGAITAALFLQAFVGLQKGTKKQIPWAHLDIAGPIYAELPLIPYWQFGATGYGVRTLAQLVERFGK